MALARTVEFTNGRVLSYRKKKVTYRPIITLRHTDVMLFQLRMSVAKDGKMSCCAVGCALGYTYKNSCMISANNFNLNKLLTLNKNN